MPLVLAVLVLPVVAYCSVRAVAPRLGGVHYEHRPEHRPEHRRSTDAWHVLMGLAMAAMLLGILTRPLAIAVVAVCAVWLVWGVLAVERRTGAGARVRLMVGAGAMAVMTLPLAAPATAADGAGPSTGMSGMSGMSGPSSMPLVLALLIGLLAVAAVRVPHVVRRSPGAVARLDAGCDVVMTGAMAVMLLALL